MDLTGLIARSTASGWALCVIGLAGLFGIWRLYVIARPKMKELEIGEQAGLRREFIEEMHALREEVKGLREENTELRKEIRELHYIIDGMRRENLAAQVSGQRVVKRALAQGAVGTAMEALEQLPQGRAKE